MAESTSPLQELEGGPHRGPDILLRKYNLNYIQLQNHLLNDKFDIVEFMHAFLFSMSNYYRILISLEFETMFSPNRIAINSGTLQIV